jgi:hypothetical protein
MVMPTAAITDASQRWSSTLGRLNGRTSRSWSVPEETSWPIAPAERMSAIAEAGPASGARLLAKIAAPSGNTVTMNSSPTRIGLVKRWRRNATRSVRFTPHLPRAARARR